jgi:hypothetical protein
MSTTDETMPAYTQSWSLYYHDPDNEDWSEESYKKLGSPKTFEEMFGMMQEIGAKKFLEGMYFWMQDPYPPMWENKMNKRGGSYSIKIHQEHALECFERYMTASVMRLVALDPKNEMVGVTISPKKGFNIIKLWNLQSLVFKKETDIRILVPNLTNVDIIYKPHVDQKMS